MAGTLGQNRKFVGRVLVSPAANKNGTSVPFLGENLAEIKLSFSSIDATKIHRQAINQPMLEQYNGEAGFL